MTFWPVPQEPVKTILAISSCADMAAPMLNAPSAALTELTTPAGSISFINSIMRSDASGVIGDGLLTTVLPLRSAGKMCQTAISTGKFHGVIDPTTPSGLRYISTRPSGVSCSTSIGSDRLAV